MKYSYKICLIVLALSCQKVAPKLLPGQHSQGFSADAAAEYSFASVCPKPAAPTTLALSAEAPNYADDIAPLMLASCTGCHGAANPSGNLSLTTAAQVQAGITDVIGRMSRLAGQAGVMPPAGPLGADSVALLQKWQADGFPLIAAPPPPPEEEEEKPEEETEDPDSPDVAGDPNDNPESNQSPESQTVACSEDTSVNSPENLTNAASILQTGKFQSCRAKGGFYDRRKGGSCLEEVMPAAFACEWSELLKLEGLSTALMQSFAGYAAQAWTLEQCQIYQELPIISMYKLSLDQGKTLRVHVKVISSRAATEAAETGEQSTGGAQ